MSEKNVTPDVPEEAEGLPPAAGGGLAASGAGVAATGELAGTPAQGEPTPGPAVDDDERWRSAFQRIFSGGWAVSLGALVLARRDIRA